MATATNDIDDIRRKMAKIRRELHEDVRDVVASAEAVTDWKHYVRTYPWASVALACAVGFLVVPKRKKPTVQPAEVAKAVMDQMPRVVEHVEPPKKQGKGLIAAGLGLIAPVAIRAAQGYATQFIANWIAQQQGQMAEMMAAAGMMPAPGAPSPSAPPGAGPAGGHPGGMGRPGSNPPWRG